MTRDEMIAAIIRSDYDMLSEKDLYAMFCEWCEANMRDMPDTDIEEAYNERFGD